MNVGSKVKAHNSVAGGYFRYYAPLFSWSIRELTTMDRTTRRILHTRGDHHKRASVARLYLPRPKGGRGLTGVELEWERAVVSAATYRMQSTDPQVAGTVLYDQLQEKEGHRTQLTAARKVLEKHGLDPALLDGEGPRGETIKPAAVVGRLKAAQLAGLSQSLESRRIHGVHAREVGGSNTNRRATNQWLVEGLLDSRTEADLIAAQDGVTATRKYLVEVAKQEGSVQCRACEQAPESLGHILSACPVQLFHLIKQRHDRVLYLLVRAVHGALGLGLPKDLLAPGGVARPGVYGTDQLVVTVDTTHPTDGKVPACRPDLVVRMMDHPRRVYIFDVACPWEGRVLDCEREKYAKYQPLAAELARQWKAGVEVIPMVIGVLGMVKSTERLLQKVHFLDGLAIKALLATAQREVLVCSLRILKQHLKQ